MFWWKRGGLDFLPGLTGNQRLMGNTHVGIPSAHKQEKLALKTLIHGTLMICSKTKLNSEFDRVKQMLIENGYPGDVLLSCIQQKLTNFAAEKPCGPEKSTVYLKLPWIGNFSSKFENQIIKAITSCFYTASCGLQY